MLIHALFLFAGTGFGLGINCRGSAICPLATFENTQDVYIMQALRDEIFASDLPNSTFYGDGEHITCVGNTIQIQIGPAIVGIGGGIPAGAICAFSQKLDEGGGLTLDQIKTLSDTLLEHGCKTCGSVPINFLQGDNDVDNGELTFNFVSEEHAECTGNCISGGHNDGSDDNSEADSDSTVTVTATVTSTYTDSITVEASTPLSDATTTSFASDPGTTESSSGSDGIQLNGDDSSGSLGDACHNRPMLSMIALSLLWTLTTSII